MAERMRGTNKPFRLKIYPHGSTEALTPSDLADVEITIGDEIRKTYTDGDIVYDTTTEASNPRWVFNLSQAETYSLTAGSYPIRLRVKYVGASEYVDGKVIGNLKITASGTEEIL